MKHFVRAGWHFHAFILILFNFVTANNFVSAQTKKEWMENKSNMQIKGLRHYCGGLCVKSGKRTFLGKVSAAAGTREFGADSTLVLVGDYHVPSQTKLVIGRSNGDCLSVMGGGNALFLYGNLEVPADRKIAIVSSDLVIDGGGNKFVFENEKSAIFIAQGVKLTLKNMTLEGLAGDGQVQGKGILELCNVVCNIAPGVRWTDSETNLVVDGTVGIYGGGELCLGTESPIIIKKFSSLLTDADSRISHVQGDDIKRHILPADATSRVWIHEQSSLARPSLRFVQPHLVTRFITSTTFPQYPNPYVAGTLVDQFDDSVAATLAADVATWATSIEQFVINNSNAMVYLTKNNSNTMLHLAKNNSNAIAFIDAQLQTIDHGPEDIVIIDPIYVMTHDIELSEDHFMFFEDSCVVDGGGHSITFASRADGVLGLFDDVVVVFNDVVFKNYNDTSFLFGNGARAVFAGHTRFELSEQQYMLYPWVFSGEIEIRGHGNRLIMDPFGSIRVLPGGSLSMHDLSLDGLKANNLRCEGSDSSLEFKDCELCLANDYSFTYGSILFSQDVRLTGTNVFSYESDLVSTITTHSRLHIENATFRYAPVIANPRLLQFYDDTAELFLDGATLVATATGMNLTTGRLLVNHISRLVNDGAVSVSEGFLFGNGVSGNDLNIQMMPGASLDLVSGVLGYQNVNA